MADAEIDAMQKVSEALSDLSPEVTSRVLRWAVARYEVTLPTAERRGTINVKVPTEPSFGDFADLFHAAEPKSHAERALLAAYWLSGSSGEVFQSQAVNSLLKDLGFQVANITDALSQNMKERPALVVQVKKSGSTQQARKLYKITDAGIRRIKSMTSTAINGDVNG